MELNRLLPFVPSFSDELVKIAYVFGAQEPDTIEHAAIPYKHRKADYVDYLGAKSKEKPTGYPKSMAVGGAFGAGLGALAGLGGGGKGALLGAGIGGALGIGGGAIAAHGDKSKIQHAKDTLKNPAGIDRVIGERIADRASSREASEYWTGERRHQELMRQLRKEAGLKGLLGGLALAGTMAGGAKMVNKIPTPAPSAVKTMVGGAGSNAKTLAQYGIRA